jgi:hypothetical protein
MKKAAEFQRHAQDCRASAARAQTEQTRVSLLKMAEAWEALARNQARENSDRFVMPRPFRLTGLGLPPRVTED